MVYYMVILGSLTGTVSRDGYFLQCINILVRTFVYALIVFEIFQSFSVPYIIINFLFASLKLLTNLEMLTENLLTIPCSAIGRCSLQCRPLIGCRENGQELTCMILQNHRRLPVSIFSVKIAALESLKRVTGRIFKISK